MLHNNTLNIGLDMSKVKLPVAMQWAKAGTSKYGKESLNEYLGVRGLPAESDGNKGIGDYQIVPHLAYYDIFKNYYANKQEERFYVMGGSTIQNATTIETQDFTGKMVLYSNTTLECTTPCTITITGKDVKIENIKKVLFTIDTQPIYLDIVDTAGRVSYDIVNAKKDEITITTKEGTYYRISKILQGSPGQV